MKIEEYLEFRSELSNLQYVPNSVGNIIETFKVLDKYEAQVIWCKKRLFTKDVKHISIVLLCNHIQNDW